MKKKTRNNLFLFLAISLILITIFSIVYWFEYKDDLDKLDYIGDSKWQKPVMIEENIITNNISAISEKNFLKLFYIKKNQNTNEESLIIKRHNFSGEKISEKEVLKAPSLNNFSVINGDNYDHLFAIIGDSDEKQNLKYYKIDENDKIESQKVLLDDLSYSLSLNTLQNNDDFYIGLTTNNPNTNKNYIKLIHYNSNSNEIKSINKTDKNEEGNLLGLRYPQLLYNEDTLYLTYLREDPSKLFASSNDKTNKRQVVLETLSKDLNNKSDKEILDRAYKRDKNSVPEMIVDNGNLNIFYHKYDLIEKVVNMNKLVFSLNNHEYNESEKIDSSVVSKLDHLKRNDKHFIILNKFDNIDSLLYLYQGSNLNDLDKANRLFSQYKTSSNPGIFQNEKGLHVIWTENNKNRQNIYYSNNINSRKAGFFEIMGLNVSREKSVFFIAPLYMMAMPFVALIKNFHILFISAILLILLYISTNKFNLEKVKNKLDNVYISYILIMIIFGIMSAFLATFSNFFFPAVPELKFMPLMFLAAFIAVLVMLSRSEIDTDLSPFLAIGGSILWFYWVSQINLVFFISHYFF